MRASNYEQTYSELLTVFYELVQSRTGEEITPGDGWRADAQSLCRKLFRHLISMKSLCEIRADKPPGSLPIHYVDHSSVQVVTRAAMETFLVYFYVFGENDLQRSKFRHSTWYLGGLLDRQKLKASSSEFDERLAYDRLEIVRLREEIEASQHFAAYSKKWQRQLLKGDWKVGTSWSEIAVSAGFHKTNFDNMYSHSCGYSHSSYISAMQGAQARDLAAQCMLANANLGFGIQIMTHFLKNYARNVSSAKEVLASDAEARRLIDKWHFDWQVWEGLYNPMPVTKDRADSLGMTLRWTQ
ncbi:DUF5677 domain-containing protein [Rugamonas sp. DEMB1]|uniref:DUF5677 domain-containing protein n=1 Tax=Rugamonas sp. DEMB1 TaxID=3039386 RepID=UPI002448727A|nr:DUF5677 domain-containing protein [Rugamonas sp. DEMB1]WGG52113.1 DUF5677 domain-containing protein [Rugamonas sp. DEMB1]